MTPEGLPTLYDQTEAEAALDALRYALNAAATQHECEEIADEARRRADALRAYIALIERYERLAQQADQQARRFPRRPAA